jgi:recombinational DNA repair ATPase RecF
MSDHSPEVVAETGAEIGSELQIQTTQDYHELRRYQQIHTARERYLKAELMASSVDAMQAAQYRSAAHTAALQYLRELEPIMRRTGSELLEEAVIWVAGPAPVRDMTNRALRPESQDLTARMETTYEELLAWGGDPISYEVEYTYFDPMSSSRKRDTYRGSSRPPIRALAQVVRHCDRFVESVLPFRLEEEDSPLVL